MSDTSELVLPDDGLPRVVVVGGGFAGINLVKGLRKAACRVVLLERNNFHQFQPLLYQVATCGLEPDSIIFPLRKLFGRQKNVSVRMAEVRRIDTSTKTVYTSIGHTTYDILVLATGSVTNFFGNTDLERQCIGMKNIRESLDIRSLMLQNLELAANCADPAEKDALTNFVVVGGGPAGVETIGALSEFKKYTLSDDYPEINPDDMDLILIQSGGAILKGMSEKAQLAALDDLRTRLNVDVVLENRVQSYDGLTVTTNKGQTFAARTVIWTAGVCGDLPEGIDESVLTRGNRVTVNRRCEVEGLDNVFVIGDAASMPEGEDWPKGHPMVAPAAIQQGKFLAESLLQHFSGSTDGREFSYRDKGSLATIGKRRAVADVGRFKLKGWLAWVIWSTVHVLSLIGFRNKLGVFLSWMLSYFSFEKGNRFIIRRYSQARDTSQGEA